MLSQNTGLPTRIKDMPGGYVFKSGHREIQIFTFISISTLFAMIR